MKYCKKCGVLYTTDVCPKCGVIPCETDDSVGQAQKTTVRRHWVALLIAIPLSILLILGVLYLMKTIMH